MTKTVIKIDGMMCGMCEAHINDAIRRQFKVKKVAASRSRGEAVIIAESAPDGQLLTEVVRQTGYTPGEITTEPYEKKGFLGLG